MIAKFAGLCSNERGPAYFMRRQSPLQVINIDIIRPARFAVAFIKPRGNLLVARVEIDFEAYAGRAMRNRFPLIDLISNTQPRFRGRKWKRGDFRPFT